MNKQYIAPQVEVATLGIQSIICASGEPAPGMQVKEKTTTDVW